MLSTRRRPSRALLAALAGLLLVPLAQGCGDTLYDKATEIVQVATTLADTAAYDAAGDAWSRPPKMPVPLAVQTAVVAPSGRLYVLASGTDAALRFDPAASGGAGAWTALPRLPIARAEAVAVTVGSLVCVLSGYGPGGPLQLVEVLDDAAPSPVWTRLGMPFRRSDVVAVGLPDRLLVIGGRDERGVAQQDIWELSPVATSSIWRPIGFLSTPRALAGVFVEGGTRIHVLGGHAGNGVALASEEVIDLAAGTVSAPRAIPTARIAPQVVLSGERAYVLDARFHDLPVTRRVDRFDPADPGTGWTSRAQVPHSLEGASYAALPGGRLLSVGGFDGGETTIQVWLLDDGSGAWQQRANLPYGAFGGFIAPVGGRPLYVGGVMVEEERRELDEGDFFGF
jgi:hypothetical protein